MRIGAARLGRSWHRLAPMVSEATPAEPAAPADGLKQVPVPELALFVVWAVTLAALCSRVSDWAVMTDELLYERLALSFVDGAFLPTLHGAQRRA
jgi:hypothetical protein